MRRLRYALEYALLRLALALLAIVPVRAASRCAVTVADVFYVLAAKRRRSAIANILLSGVRSDAQAAARLARASFRHFAVLAIEALKAGPFFERHDWRRSVEWHISPEVDRVLREPGAGVLLASGHIGNWEVAAQLISALKPVMGITRRMNNPYAERLVQRYKPRNRFYLAPKHDAGIDRFLDALGKGHVLAIMIDQHARDRGMAIPFLGRPAATHTGIAMLHLITNTPLVFGYCLRTGPMRYSFHATGPFHHKRTGDKAADVRAILTQLTNELENAVREHPEQYLWGHRRWKIKAPAENGHDTAVSRTAEEKGTGPK